jgi:gluconate 5-dehydrogenase
MRTVVDPFSLQGRVALVTGASRGLGAGMASGLALAGAHVVLNGWNLQRLQARQQEITRAGGQASIAAFDVCARADADAAIDAITAQHGHLDILINNAVSSDACAFITGQTLVADGGMTIAI